jgi:outer membrane protein insertion porin family
VFAGMLWIGAAWGAATAQTDIPDGDDEPGQARLRVSGMGWLENRRVRQVLRLPAAVRREVGWHTGVYVEEAVVLLQAYLAEKGYPRAVIDVELKGVDGEQWKGEATSQSMVDVPGGWPIRETHLRVTRGTRYYIEDIRFLGLEAIPVAEARRFFIPGDALVILRGSRAYNEARVERGVRNLASALRAKGFEDCEVRVGRLARDDESGAVKIAVVVEVGVRSVLRSVEVRLSEGDGVERVVEAEEGRGRSYSDLWRQDLIRRLRNDQEREGRLDAEVTLEVRREVAGDEGPVQVDVEAVVDPGEVSHVGAVRFEGLTNTRMAVVQSRVRLRPGDVLDRSEAARGRQRLSRLGMFDSVGMRIEPTDDPVVRDLVYELSEAKRFEVGVLAGFGSYELLRGGVDLEWRNAFGQAHQFRVRGIQSFKSTTGDALYSIPAHLGEEITLFLNASALRREEVSFRREEYGGGAGVRRFFPGISSDLGLRYSYEFLNAIEAPVSAGGVEESPTELGALIVDFNHDRRDNPLNPRRGLKFFATVEVASEVLGGRAEYQRIELSSSAHFRLGGGRFLHMGLSHGVIMQAWETAGVLPFNKRFFPGGENSIRGYQRGEASPLNASGEAIGAETFLLGTVEIEQALTPSWSLVAFVDAVTVGRELSSYPGDEPLYSVGGGLRLKTVIGPARIEYGYNLNPRTQDPQGTLHFSLGFPF